MSAAAPTTTLARPRVRAPTMAPALALGALVAASVVLRAQALDAGLWIDEGLSAGIAGHDVGDIPGLLRHDGSPPLYYVLLHGWIELFGRGTTALHSLSAVFAAAFVPVAWLAGRTLFGTPAGWACAALGALSPFLTFHAQEARMYALLALLGLGACALFALAFVHGRRRALPAFALVLALALYTHNWALFLACGLAVALLVQAVQARQPAARRALLHDGALGFGAALALYAPWIPSLAAQLRTTGAPWSDTPGALAPLDALSDLLGGPVPAVVLALGAAAGLRRLRGTRWRAVTVLAAGALVAIAVAWAFSQASPAWAGRYFAILLGPLVLIAGAGLAHAGRAGIAALAVVLVVWADPRVETVRGKSNVAALAAQLQARDLLGPGDLAVVTHPEQTPVLRHYLGTAPAWADLLGLVRDPAVFDWRDAMERLRAARPESVAPRVLATARPGARVVLFLPITRTGRWTAPWPVLVRQRAAQWQRLLDARADLRRVVVLPRIEPGREPRGVRAVVYVKERP